MVICRIVIYHFLYSVASTPKLTDKEANIQYRPLEWFMRDKEKKSLPGTKYLSCERRSDIKTTISLIVAQVWQITRHDHKRQHRKGLFTRGWGYHSALFFNKKDCYWRILQSQLLLFCAFQASCPVAPFLQPSEGMKCSVTKVSTVLYVGCDAWWRNPNGLTSARTTNHHAVTKSHSFHLMTPWQKTF